MKKLGEWINYLLVLPIVKNIMNWFYALTDKVAKDKEMDEIREKLENAETEEEKRRLAKRLTDNANDKL